MHFKIRTDTIVASNDLTQTLVFIENEDSNSIANAVVPPSSFCPGRAAGSASCRIPAVAVEQSPGRI